MSNKKIIPAISVIIPMYNAEKYIGECLDSIFAQTFDDYEIIVVDDCSTDKSCEVVENYIPKFNGRLQLIKSEKNSGGAGTPRNIGIKISRGEYIFLMDNDDAIISTALEKFYCAAEDFHADVVHCDKYYQSPDETALTDIKVLKSTSRCNPDVPFTEPKFLPENITERIKKFAEFKMLWEPWSHFIRRKVVSENDLYFPSLSIADDYVFSVFLLLTAKKFLLLPETFYVWRQRNSSHSRKKVSIEKNFLNWGIDVIKAITEIEKFMSQKEEFSRRTDYKYAFFDTIINSNNWAILSGYTQISAYQLDEILREELSKIDDKTALTAFLFGRMSSLNINIIRQNQIIQNQQAQIQQLKNGMNALAHNEQIKIFLREKFHNLIQKYSTIMPDEKFEQVKDYRIFVCWLQGEKNLPPIVQTCYNSLKMNAGDYKICFIDEKNFSDYVELPEHILKKFREGKITRVHFSDILRANLLEKFGGLWVDSTILVTDPLEKHKNLLEQHFYTQKICQTKDMQNEFVRNMGDIVYVTYARWSSFLQGSSILHNPLFTFAKDFYNEYWKKFDELVSYFLIDFMIDIAYEKIPFVKNEIDAVPINNPDIYDLLRHLNDKYSAYPYEKILSKNFFHKLSYKDPVNYNDKENVLNAIIQKYR
ncbi:MAG: glycosyltransferase [Selenomonadaceae bacterium]|nr:glycosyltransferase [Selenomonadaceae bacterium]